jgi:hypothetical protein
MFIIKLEQAQAKQRAKKLAAKKPWPKTAQAARNAAALACNPAACAKYTTGICALDL